MNPWIVTMAELGNVRLPIGAPLVWKDRVLPVLRYINGVHRCELGAVPADSADWGIDLSEPLQEDGAPARIDLLWWALDRLVSVHGKTAADRAEFRSDFGAKMPQAWYPDHGVDQHIDVRAGSQRLSIVNIISQRERDGGQLVVQGWPHGVPVGTWPTGAPGSGWVAGLPADALVTAKIRLIVAQALREGALVTR